MSHEDRGAWDWERLPSPHGPAPVIARERVAAETTGTCPACNGSTRQPASQESWKATVAGYDAVTDTWPCTNCGGQYMFARPTGQVPLRADGTPCLHEYEEVGPMELRRYGDHRYQCKRCGDRREIDSGD